ncbi:carbohydrate binding family 9 domain-containing protein [Parapedobacter tibetensis]|uniref:carbohydrate binding family 9 domain-containing protein n=1 Tax=Parapedobacter tibetensis TaxID=2972951 RepID=UPI00214DEDE5|nr:carbohydrate binding family 9 domain-containing protein [Parapedobacter tibetensis]
MDGFLDESDWGKTEVASNFTQIQPQTGNKAYFITEVKSLYTASSLYFGIVCYDTIGRNNVKAPDLKRDFNFQNHDLVGITIDGFNDERNGITVFANPYGAQRDYLSFDDTYFDVDWNGLWKVRTTRTDDYWVAEFEIPWKTLRYKLSDSQTPVFGINFQRVQRTSNERSAWSFYPRSVGFNRMEHAGKMSGFIPPEPMTNIQVNPYTLFSDNPDGATEFKAGGEVKWVITPNLVLDATVNTDFAQADVDQLVNNTTRFSVLFPEKRQFFLENSSLFGVGISGDGGISGNVALIPFFSRRIGLDANSRPIPIAYGGRAVHRSNKRNFGAMFLQQKGSSNGANQKYFVGRYSENIGKNNRIGAIVTGVTGKATDATTALNSRFDYTTAIDGFFRLNPQHSINAMISLTGDKAGNNMGWAGYVQYEYKSDRINAWLASTWISDKFDPKSGFISRRNIIATMPGVELSLREKWLPFKRVVRDYEPGIFAEIYHEASTGNILEQKIAISPLSFNFIKGGKMGVSYSYNYQRIAEDFSPVGLAIGMGTYTYNNYEIYYSSDGSRKISYDISYQTGGYFNGKLHTLDVSLAYSPKPYISLGASIGANDFEKVGIMEEDKSVNLFSFDSRFAVNPRLQFTFLYQRNTLDKSNLYNARLSWEYKPLSFVYLVFNSREYGLLERTNEQNTIVKVSFLKQL